MGTEKRQRKKENRQARLEAERAAAARAKRRKQLVTAVAVTFGVLVVLIALSWGAGGDDDDTAADDTTATTGTTEPPTTTTTVPVRPAAEAPEVTVPEGEEPPTELVQEDLEEGDGETVEPGDTVTVNYTGVAWSTGEEFDSSWGEEGGQAVTFGLDQVIEGWGEGLVGMQEGGRRRLVIPPDLAYGDTPPPGSGIEPGETLVFVVDLEAVD